MHKILGLALALGTMAGLLILEGGDIRAYFSLTGFLWVAGVAGGFTWMSARPGTSPTDLLLRLRLFLPLSGLIGTIVGGVFILQHLGGDTRQLGPAVAMALMSLLYGLVGYCIVIALIQGKSASHPDLDAR